MPNSKINKILFDISLPEADKNDALKKAKDLFYFRILNVINDVFDHYDGMVSIPKLDIDLGALPENELESALKIAILKQLQNAPQSTTFIDQQLSFNKVNDLPHNRENVLSSSDHFLYFLQYGYWPWHMQGEDENVIRIFLLDYFKDDEKTNVLLQLLPHQSKNVLDRLLMLAFSEARLRTLFLSALQKYHTLFDQFTALMPSAYEHAVLLDHGFVYQLFYQLLQHAKLQSLNDIKELVLKTWNDGYSYNGQLIKLNEENSVLVQQDIQEAQSAGDLKIITDTVLKMQHDAIHNLSSTRKESGTNLNKEGNSENNRTSESKSQKGFEPMLTEEDGKINISNAGLVLFHLYLPYIFKDLKWINASNKFTDAKKQQKAVHFLQYLIDEKSRHPEYVLVLNKMLCGWPIHLPLTLNCNFSKKEKEIAVEAIDSLKEHWTVMKNTSALGLMESFVKRQGIVQRNQSGYLLQIERKTIDVLLDSLPFGIGTIKLPWNEYIISTEW